MPTPRKTVGLVSGPAKNVRSVCCDAPLMLFKDKFYLCSKCHEWHGIKYEAEIQSSDKAQQSAAKPVREEECLLGYDVGKEGGDETVALYGKRHEDGYVEVTKRVEGLWVGPTENSKPYVPKVGDRVVLEGEVVEIEEGGRLNVKLQPSAGEIYLYPKDVENGVLKLLSRKTRKLTKEEAELLLSEKLGESVRIE